MTDPTTIDLIFNANNNYWVSSVSTLVDYSTIYVEFAARTVNVEDYATSSIIGNSLFTSYGSED